MVRGAYPTFPPSTIVDRIGEEGGRWIVKDGMRPQQEGYVLQEGLGERGILYPTRGRGPMCMWIIITITSLEKFRGLVGGVALADKTFFFSYSYSITPHHTRQASLHTKWGVTHFQSLLYFPLSCYLLHLLTAAA